MTIHTIEPEEDGFHHPASEGELVALVRRAYHEGLQLRVRGSAHSISRAIYTDPLTDAENHVHRHTPPPGKNLNVMLDRLRCWKVRDEARRIVEAQAGIHLGDDPSATVPGAGVKESLLYQLFTQKRWTLTDLGGITHQTISGFTGTGSSGGSLTFTVNKNLYGFRVIDGRGEVREVTRDDADPSLFHAMAPSLGVMGVVSAILFECEPSFNLEGEERITTYAECQTDIFGEDPARPSLERWLIDTEYGRLEWWPQRGGERIEVWKVRRIGDQPGFKPDPYRQFGKNPTLQQLGISIFFNIANNLGGLGAARRNLRESFRYFGRRLGQSLGGSPPARALAGLAALLGRLLVNGIILLLTPFAKTIARRMPSIFRFVLKTFIPLDKGKPHRFTDWSWHGLPVDYEADDELVPAGFTEAWIPIGRTTETMRLMRKYFEEPKDDLLHLARTGTFAWEIYGAPPSEFWMSPSYSTGDDEWKDGVVRVDPYWFEQTPSNPAVSFFPPFWKLLRDNGIPFRLHWGKYQPVIPEGDPEGWVAYFRARYPRWDDFLALREERDPNNIFLTSYWRERLGLREAPRPHPIAEEGAVAAVSVPLPFEPSPGLTDIHAHPAMNAYFFDRDLRRHYMSGKTFNPLASLSDFPLLKKGNVRVLWSVLHVPEHEFLECKLIRFATNFTRGGRKMRRLNAWEVLLDMMGEMERQVLRGEERFDTVLVRDNAELDAAVAAGKRAIVHTVEGGHVLGAGLAAGDLDGRLKRLEELSARGVASLTLAHIFPTELAGHVESITAAQHNLPLCPLDTKVDECRGLSAIGEAVVEKMIALRMVPDLTHCTQTARRQVFELVGNRIPLVVTHTGVRALNPVSYNMIREEVRAIHATGGVTGVIFMPHWLDHHNPKRGLDVIWRTMETMAAWAESWEVVAIGTDFDGLTDPPDDVDNAGKFPLVAEMLHRKLKPAEADAVLGGNARRVLRMGWR